MAPSVTDISPIQLVVKNPVCALRRDMFGFPAISFSFMHLVLSDVGIYRSYVTIRSRCTSTFG